MSHPDLAAALDAIGRSFGPPPKSSTSTRPRPTGGQEEAHVKVRFVKQYTLSYKGSSATFRDYDGGRPGLAVAIRTHVNGHRERTNAEADQEATRQLRELSRKRRLLG